MLFSVLNFHRADLEQWTVPDQVIGVHQSEKSGSVLT